MDMVGLCASDWRVVQRSRYERLERPPVSNRSQLVQDLGSFVSWSRVRWRRHNQIVCEQGYQQVEGNNRMVHTGNEG
jgi:hypothetical protein